MKWAIFFCVLTIILLSGCLDIISTRQKQLCVSSTDYSQTSIPDCDKFSECFKEMSAPKLNVSAKMPIQIKNKTLLYQNQISSSTFYFNKAKKEIQKINSFCSGDEDIKIIKSVNDLFFYISKIFSYQDNAWQESTEILKDYALYLKSQDVELITEEQVYEDFVLLNQNLNELRNEEINNESYVGLLKEEAKTASELANQFGFKKSYLSTVNYIDIYAYYSDYVENPEQELKFPTISKSSNYVFSKLSTLENFNKINARLSEADNYNLYVLFDKHFGLEDSLFIRFTEINNRVNDDLAKLEKTIKTLEKNIDDNTEYLEEYEKQEYLELKKKYSRDQITFGKYLARLKEIAIKISENKELADVENEKISLKIEDCDNLIKDAKNYKNQYFKELTENYYNQGNYYDKIDICEKLRIALSEKNCYANYDKLISLGYLEDANITPSDCVETINQLNYNLKNNEKILLFNELLEENQKLLNTLGNYELDYETKIKLAIISDKLETFDKFTNTDKLFKIEDYLLELSKLYSELNDIIYEKTKERNEIDYVIEFKEGKYILNLNNDSEIKIKDFCFTPRDINLSEMTSANREVNITNKEICIDELELGKNEFGIYYKNKKTIITKIINLSVDDSLLETRIKNTVVGIQETLNIGQVNILENNEYYIDEQGQLHYLTQKENVVLYLKKILDKKIIDANISKTDAEYIKTENFTITNKLAEPVSGKVAIIACENCLASVKENSKLKSLDYSEYGKGRADLYFEAYETKTIIADIIVNYEEITDETNDILSRIYFLTNCEYADLAEKCKTDFSNILGLINKTDFSMDEINQILKYKEKLENYEEQYDKRKQLLDNTNALISQILSENILTTDDLAQITEIEKTAESNPALAYQNLLALKKDIDARITNQTQKQNSEFENRIKTLIDVAKKTGVVDSETIDKLNTLKFSEAGETELALIESDINSKINIKNREINEYIDYFNNLDKKEALNLVDQVNWAYEGVTLSELYAVKYYPKITTDDADRLKKKLNYLDTVSFKESSQRYQDLQNNNIDLTTLERLKDINSEISLINGGLLQFEEDANTEINKLSNSKTLKTKDNQNLLLKIKNDYDNKRHLLVILSSRKIENQPSEAPKINYQIFAIIGLIFISGIAIVVFNKKGFKKPLTKEEKKQKILRHY